MYFAPFFELFPQLAQRETRTLTAINHPLLPPGDYSFVEAYCNEVGCDCRRVMFSVFAHPKNEMVAVIAYGWENKAFYAQWLGDNNPSLIAQLQGPALNIGSPQSPLGSCPIGRNEHRFGR